MNTIQRTIDDFFVKYTKLHYKKGEIILRAGDPPPGVLHLTRGLVRMSCAAPTGEMLVLHVFKPGSFFPLPWVINDTPNRYYFESLTPVEIWRAPREDVKRFFRQQSEVAEYVMSKLLLGISGMLQRMEYLVFDSAYRKTVLLLIYYAKNFTEDGSKGKFSIPLTHKEIAAWIGTTRETASLQIETLKRKKLIVYNRRYITIPNITMLEKEVEMPL